MWRPPRALPSSIVAGMVACATGWGLAAPGRATAADGDARAQRRSNDLRVDLPVDLAVTLTAGAAWAVSERLKGPVLGPRSCRWCDPGFDASIRNAVVWNDASAAVRASNIGAIIVAPVAAVGLTAFAAAAEHAPLAEVGIDVLLIAEATALAGDLDQLVKFSVGRQRPFARAGRPNPDTAQIGKHDENVSFYSGHTNLTFALAASAGTVATMRRYRMAPAIWIVGAAIGATTGYLRMAADQHYFTDVVTGALLGTAVGMAVPWTFHRPRAETATHAGAATLGGGVVIPMPTQGGAALLYLW